MRRSERYTLLTLVLTSASPGFASTFDLQEPAEVRVSEASPPGAGDWSNAQLLPLALAFASSEAHRAAAAGVGSLGELKPGPDGVVDLSLSALVDLTLGRNLDILVRSYDPAVSEEAVEARRAIFDPLLSFTVALFSSTSPTSASLAGAEVLSQDQAQWNASIRELLPHGGTVGVGITNSRSKSNNRFATLNPAYSSDLSFSFSQPLLRDFGRAATTRDIRIARNDRDATRVRFRQLVMAKVTDAVDAYWDLYGRGENLDVAREGLALARELLDINNKRVEIGTMAPLDISLAEAEVARNEQFVINAESDLQGAKDRILQLVNAPLDSPLWNVALRPVDRPDIEAKEIDVDGVIRTAIAKRPEIRSQELATENARLRLEQGRNALKPSLELESAYGFTGLGGTSILRSETDGQVVGQQGGGYGDALDNLLGLDFDNWRVALVLGFPLFNRQAEAGHAQSLLALRQSEDSLAAVRQQVAVEVRRIARLAQTARKQIDASQATRRHQEKRLEAESKKFEHGLSTNFEVQQAQKDLTEARSGEVLATTTYLRSIAALHNAVGTILDDHGVRLEE